MERFLGKRYYWFMRGESMKAEYVLQAKNISKEYYGNKVLKGVSFDIKPGEVLALVGENGAGKSTLMNILFGMSVIHETGGYRGNIVFDGKETVVSSPNHAMELGIGMVHQEFLLIPGFSITENIKVNREITTPNIISRITTQQLEMLDLNRMNSDAHVALGKIGIALDEKRLVRGLPVGYMQFIEIAREIDKSNIKLLVFDEPTAVLSESEANKLLDCIRDIKASGIAVIFISHRLDEVVDIADSVIVLRDGELIAKRDRGNINVTEIAALMVGRDFEVFARTKRVNAETAEIAMNIRNLSVKMPGERVDGVNLEVKKGEILGIGGLAGHGKIGIANGIMGIYKTTGEVIWKGAPLQLNSPQKSLESGIAFVSEDRRGVGLLLDESIETNIMVTAMQVRGTFLKKIGPAKFINKKQVRAHADKMITELDIRCRGPQQVVRRLSGGNQQKVCIARALTINPEILFVSEPTRGVDIGAKKILLENIVRLNQEKNVTIVITSSELNELRSICDRIAVVSEGKVVGILQPDDCDADFGLMMAGHSKTDTSDK
jgi:simple sugar transport system ATP-binding protein